MDSVKTTLLAFGLTDAEAEIYLTLSNFGEMDAGTVAERTSLSRTAVYDAFDTLFAHDLIEYRKEGRHAFYKAAHPQQLAVLMEQKKNEHTLLLKNMEESMRQLTGAYELAEHKAGVRFFEGYDGMRESLFHSLTASETIYTYLNAEVIRKYAKSLNEEYIQKRLEKGIAKRIILPDSEASRAYIVSATQELTEYKLLPDEHYAFDVATEIYNDNVTFLHPVNEHIAAFHISHPSVATLHRTIFEALWDQLPNYSPESRSMPDETTGNSNA